MSTENSRLDRGVEAIVVPEDEGLPQDRGVLGLQGVFGDEQG